LLVITPGEPAGIGPEIALKLAREHPELRLVAVADPDCLLDTATALGIDVPLVDWNPAVHLAPGSLGCLSVRMPYAVTPGQPDPRNANYVLDTLRQAVQLLVQGAAGALVTGPVHKALINQAGIAFSGHTEFLAELAGRKQVVMMLATPGLRVALVTTHLPLRQVADAISQEKLEAVMHHSVRLQLRFGIRQPHSGAWANPHAGEQGHLGGEDRIIGRRLRCRSSSVFIEGVPAVPLSATPLAACGAVIAMYRPGAAGAETHGIRSCRQYYSRPSFHPHVSGFMVRPGHRQLRAGGCQQFLPCGHMAAAWPLDKCRHSRPQVT
jgi:4-hydroxythreonine-4-phosphate dehydrogenase